ncbi:MAG: hypothetical protein J6A75_03440 [Lachnospiraceae bacterium]|nr:hypothetical protein [Lachnospiraceae bacterium]
MSKKKIILFICIAVSILAIVIIMGLMIISPTLFFSSQDAEIDEDKPQIAEDIEGLELIGSEDELKDTEIVMENTDKENTSEYNVSPTSPNYNVWEALGLDSPADNAVISDDYTEEDVGDFEGPIEVEENKELTESIFYLNNPAYLSGETNLGTNGFYNLYECVEDYFDYYFPEEPKEYEGIVIEGSYKDKGDYRSFLLEVYKEDGTTWLIECDYVVSMNYYEFFCDEINPRPKTGED